MAASDDSPDRFVLLPDGMVIPAEAYRLLLDLERRGFTLHEENDTTLVVQPPERLTSDDCGHIRRWKWHLLMLIAYCQQRGRDAHLFTDGRGTAIRKAS